MIILSHRGLWYKEAERNSCKAFERAFSKGFGIETDIRDYRGNLVISHDIANKRSMLLDTLFQLYISINKSLFIAINIKADGLQEKLKELILKYGIENYWVFDMAVPDALQCISYEMNVFTRESEYETIPSFYEESYGVWMDEFESHWITWTKIDQHISRDKKVCIVSPELHKRTYLDVWQGYKDYVTHYRQNTAERLFLCTDYPEQARSFFYD